MTASALDDIPGLGEVRRKALLRHFGSVKRLKEASVEQIREVPGIGAALGATIHATLHFPGTPTSPDVDMTTGEILA